MNELNRNDRAAWQEVRSTLDEKVNVDLRETVSSGPGMKE